MLSKSACVCACVCNSSTHTNTLDQQPNNTKSLSPHHLFSSNRLWWSSLFFYKNQKICIPRFPRNSKANCEKALVKCEEFRLFTAKVMRYPRHSSFDNTIFFKFFKDISVTYPNMWNYKIVSVKTIQLYHIMRMLVFSIRKLINEAYNNKLHLFRIENVRNNDRSRLENENWSISSRL